MIFKNKDKKFKFKWPKTSAGKEVYLKYKNFKPHQAGYFWPRFFSLECLLSALIILEIAVFSIVFVLMFQCNEPADFGEAGPVVEKKNFCLENSTSTLYAVMIDNMLEGRPSVGLGRADLVYEAPAEAGITRFLAVYCVEDKSSLAQQEAGLNPPLKKRETEGDFPIGPVRSLRPYFLDWAEELGMPVAHVGGSPEAMSLIKKSAIPNLDQYYNGKYFWRSTNRLAPHNVFTTLTKLDEFLKAKFSKFESKERDVWKYKNDFVDAQGATDDAVNPLPTLPLSKRGRDGVGDVSAQPAPYRAEGSGSGSAGQGPSAKSISIDFILPEHLVRWDYDSASNSYFRFQNGAEHKDDLPLLSSPSPREGEEGGGGEDKDGVQISAKSVIIQITNIEVIDEIGRRKIRTTGEGKATVFQDGRIIYGKWERLSKNALTRFFDLAGKEIEFNRGNIWIEVVADYHKISISN